MAAHLTKFRKASPGQEAERPLDTVSAGGEHFGLVQGYFVPRNGEREGQQPRAASTHAPALTVTTCANGNRLATAHLVQHNGGSLPAPDASYPADRPARTVLAQGGRQDVALGCLTAYYSRNGEGDHGQPVSEPLRTIPTVDRFGPVTTTCAAALSPAQLARAREVHAFLLEFLGDALAPYSQDGLVVLTLRGERYILADIGMRMLTPRELARCQGFSEDYVLEHTAEGQPISKARQVRGIGNSVCPQLAAALTRAQLGAVLEEAAD